MNGEHWVATLGGPDSWGDSYRQSFQDAGNVWVSSVVQMNRAVVADIYPHVARNLRLKAQDVFINLIKKSFGMTRQY